MREKINCCIGMILVMIFAFWGTEYLLYTLFVRKSKLFIFCFILFLLMVSFFIGIVNKFNLPNKIVAPALVLFSVFIGLGILKVTLPLFLLGIYYM